MLDVGCWIWVSHEDTKTRRREDGGVSLEDLKVEGGEIEFWILLRSLSFLLRISYEGQDEGQDLNGKTPPRVGVNF